MAQPPLAPGSRAGGLIRLSLPDFPRMAAQFWLGVRLELESADIRGVLPPPAPRAVRRTGAVGCPSIGQTRETDLPPGNPRSDHAKSAPVMLDC
jgi:hypothetical protein